MNPPKPLSQTIKFVLPKDQHLPSGGNVYNEKLIRSLRKLGQRIEIIDFDMYRQEVTQAGNAIYGVDSLFIEDMKVLQGVKKKVFSFFILHHLQSLYPPSRIDGTQYFEKHEKASLQFFDAFLLTSHFTKAYLEEKNISAPMRVVEPAADFLPSEVSTLTFPLQALMVANVVERKGILSFLESLSKVQRDGDDFVIRIIGRTDMETAYFEACQNQLKSAGLQNKIQFVGPLTHEETLRQYARHHLFISAAQMETYGMAIQEAKAYGLPLLLCEGGNSASHLTEGSGLLSPNIFKLAGNFIELCRNEALMRELWQSAQTEKNTFTVYTWDQAAADFLMLFQDFYT